MLKSDRLVCEKNAAKAQPVTNCNLGPINYIYFNYKMNLSIAWENFCNTIWDKTKNRYFMKRKRSFSKDHLQGMVTLCFQSVKHEKAKRTVIPTTATE